MIVGKRALGHRDGWVDGAGELAVQDVLGQAYDDGAGAALLCLEESLGHDAGGARRVIEDEDLLGLGAEPGLGIKFLEGLAVAVGGRDEADKEDERGGILPGGVDAHEGVGRAGAAGHHGDARLARSLAVCLRHVGGAAFLAGNDGFNGAVIKPIEDGQEAFTGNEECAAHAVGGEGFGNGGADV